MSGRGGGRGGWRGRGRGAAGGPVARDDEGKPLEVEQSGPPKLYPDLPSLPSKPELSSKDERLLTRRHLLLDYYRSLFSPYYLEFQVSRNESVEEQIRKYNGAQEVKQKPKRPKLTQVLSLEPRYFPAELYSSVQQRQSVKAQSSEAQSAFFRRTAAAEGLSRLDQLAKLESAAGEAGGKTDGPEGESKKGGEAAQEEEEDILEEQDDEEFDEEDDYYQGEAFDDDDGYDDPYDDGDGEAFF
mmetsp:Transcript_26178/g.62258  ORF Transcript_26178/g.62258 Transcript_26178/m.62258 type:complete len:242 (+) Transcript_26178:81-806(+)|eukprot:CAMPEP_0177603742 /NCGR_PEP_ID=MMETSP0419_2-20121207/15696_1 /TAXON_ID=582737 /ORGANISM="Tetraselmis sp., Strain GSL018" /LENGTH=241 /DNA_ID=CAMNT_0019097577 /DNA_START=40 /DNA_END=765 /DNA_ORIENTATION=+